MERCGGKRKGYRFLCVTACWLLLVLLSGSAAAELSPRWTQWEEAFSQGTAVIAQASLHVISVQELTEETLEQMNLLLDELTLRAVLTRQGGEDGGAAVLQLGSACAGIALQGEEEGPFLWQAAALGEHLDGLLHRAYAALDRAADASEELHAAVTVRNVGTSSGGTVWHLSGEALTAVWAVLTEEMEHDSVLGPLKARIPFLSDELVFSGNCTVKRLKDATGADFGLQVNGRVRRGEEPERKLTLLAGRKDGNAYVNLNAEPKRGSAVKLMVSCVLKETKGQNRLELSVHLQADRDETLECTLKNDKGDADTVTGTLEWTEKTGNVKTQLTLRPAFTIADDAVSGETEITWFAGGAQIAELQAGVTLTRGTEADPGMWETQGDTSALYRELLYRLERMEPEQRRLITHTLRTAEWMIPSALTAPLPADPAGAGEWSVKEEE